MGRDKKPAVAGGLEKTGADRNRVCDRGTDYHVRFLCRLDFKRFRRLCFDILRRRFFFRLPMLIKVNLKPCGTGRAL